MFIVIYTFYTHHHHHHSYSTVPLFIIIHHFIILVLALITYIFITNLISFTIISLPSYQKLCMKSLFFIRDYFFYYKLYMVSS